MAYAIRKGDQTQGDGEHGPLTIDVCSGNVVGNGKQIAVLGDKCTSGGKHGIPVIISCSSTVTINGKGVARNTDRVSCGVSFTTYSPDIIVGG